MDYHEIFAPIAKITTARYLLAVALAREFHQIDVNNIFLHGNLDKEIYMQLPYGFDPPSSTKIYHLHKYLIRFVTSVFQLVCQIHSAIVLWLLSSLINYSLFTHKKAW